MTRRCLAMLLLVVLSSSGCRAEVEEPKPPTMIRMVTTLGRLINPLGETLSKVLPEHFPVQVEVKRVSNAADYPRLIEEGEVEMAMIPTDLAYVAYTEGIGSLPRPHRKLRSVAVLYATPVHLIARKASGIRNLSDLRGKRVYVGAHDSATQFTVSMILQALGLTLKDLNVQRISGRVSEHLADASLDAAFNLSNAPSPGVKEIMDTPGVMLIPLELGQIDLIRSRHPFFRSDVIPANTYGSHPAIEAISVESVLTCRDDLPEELVYWITDTLYESLPELVKSLSILRQIDLEQIHATPIPLHPGAARFYRERELFQ